MRRVQFLPQGRALAMRADSIGMLFEVRPEASAPFEVEGDAAVVDVRGPIEQHAGWCFDSYDAIVERVKAAAASPARAVVLRIDSPGGDALGMMEAARELRGVCRGAGKPLLAFVDGMACSAAYALTTAADAVVCPPAGLVGSVGVFQPMVDATAADRAMGLAFEMVSSGERKLDGNPHIPITDAARAETQRRVDGLADLFFGLVAEMRGESKASIRALEGGIFLAAEALNVGLIDVVGTWSDVLALAGNQQAGASASATEKPMPEEMKDDKKSKARKAFFSAMEAAFDSMFGDDDGDGDEKKKPKEEGAAAASEKPPEKEDKEEKAKAEAAKAKAAEEEKEKAKALAAQANAGSVEAIRAIALKAAEDNAKLRAEIAAKDEEHARQALLAKRPDFTTEQRDLLAMVPLAEVEKAVAKWPRGPMGGKLTAPAALATGGTQGGNPNHRGEGGGSLAEVPKAEADYIGKKMGVGGGPSPGVQRKGRDLELGALTPHEARASLDKDKADRANAQKEVGR